METALVEGPPARLGSARKSPRLRYATPPPNDGDYDIRLPFTLNLVSIVEPALSEAERVRVGEERYRSSAPLRTVRDTFA